VLPNNILSGDITQYPIVDSMSKFTFMLYRLGIKWGFLFMCIISLSDAVAQIKDGCLKPGLVATTNGTELPCQEIFSRQELLECKYIADLNLLVTATARKDRLTGQLISRVKITGVDLNTGKVKYFKKTHWENFSITRQVILFNEGNNVKAISIEDGKLIWKKKNNSASFPEKSNVF
jgi:hypothetical protein